VASRWTQSATILPPTIKVCGRKLLPFSLRHRLALESIDSPLLDFSKPIGAEDVIAGARILSTHNLAEVREPLSFWELVTLKKLQVSKKNLKAEAYKLLVYFQAQALYPRFWESDKPTKDSPIDWKLIVVANLVANGLSLTEAWTMPESEAVWLHMAFLQRSGCDIKLVTDHEWEVMQKELEELENEKTKPYKRNN
jgi:hypothetical protein